MRLGSAYKTCGTAYCICISCFSNMNVPPTSKRMGASRQAANCYNLLSITNSSLGSVGSQNLSCRLTRRLTETSRGWKPTPRTFCGSHASYFSLRRRDTGLRKSIMTLFNETPVSSWHTQKYRSSSHRSLEVTFDLSLGACSVGQSHANFRTRIGVSDEIGRMHAVPTRFDGN